MILYLVRHGDALSADGSPEGDAGRRLSPQGELDIAALGLVLANVDPPVTKILTSPLVRAEQTGRIISRSLSYTLPVEPTGILAPGFRFPPVVEALGSAGAEGIVAVAHQPDCAAFLSYLVAGEPIDIHFRPGTAAAVRFDRSMNARLLWVLTPELARRITATHQDNPT